MRTQRAKKLILPDATYQLLEQAAMEMSSSVMHFVVLSGVPVVFPKVRVWFVYLLFICPINNELVFFLLAFTYEPRSTTSS